MGRHLSHGLCLLQPPTLLMDNCLFPGGETEQEKVVIDMMSGTAMDFFVALANGILFGSAEVGFDNM